MKVLDFGLAEAFGPGEAGHYVQQGAAGIHGDLTASPTMTSPAMTRLGVILGTAAYMSPEQARGKEVDKRADIWAFGCVLYEMLAGRPAFPGADVSEVLAGVIKSDVDWKALPAAVPPRVQALLRRCLQKDPKHRLRDIGDARIEIEEVVAAPEAELVAALTSPRARRERLAWSVAAVAIVAAVAAGMTAYVRSTPATDTQNALHVRRGIRALSNLVARGQSDRFQLESQGQRRSVSESVQRRRRRGRPSGGQRYRDPCELVSRRPLHSVRQDHCDREL